MSPFGLEHLTNIHLGAKLVQENPHADLVAGEVNPYRMVAGVSFQHDFRQELDSAFQIGFMLYLPFLVLDMVVASVLMAMGMMMVPPATISLPFKLMLFVLADGWNLLIGSLVASYST